MKNILVKEAITEYIVKVLDSGTPFPAVFDVFVCHGIELLNDMAATEETDHGDAYSELREIFLKIHSLAQAYDAIEGLHVFSSLYGNIIPYAKSIAPIATSSIMETKDLADSIFFGWSARSAELMFDTYASYTNGQIDHKVLASKLGDLMIIGCDASFAFEIYRSLPDISPVDIISQTGVPYYNEDNNDSPASSSIGLLKRKVAAHSVTHILYAVSERRKMICALNQ